MDALTRTFGGESSEEVMKEYSEKLIELDKLTNGRS
jgi:hypothetical protein